ncbi:hypothetical protein NEOC65_000730 [Neochlamydia sp. AcF65]|nr:hypothetical protein [Neochlamydia sp. AcF65]
MSNYFYKNEQLDGKQEEFHKNSQLKLCIPSANHPILMIVP